MAQRQFPNTSHSGFNVNFNDPGMYSPLWGNTPAPDMFGMPGYMNNFANQYNANTQMQHMMYAQNKPKMALIEALFGGGGGGKGGIGGLLEGLYKNVPGGGGFGFQSTNSPQSLVMGPMQNSPLSGLFG